MKPITAIFIGAILSAPSIVYAQKDPSPKDLIGRLATDRRVLPQIIKQGDAAVADLVEAVKMGPSAEQSLYVYALAEIARDIGPKAKYAVSALITATRSADKAVASDAARALGYIGAPATPALVKAIKAADSPNDLVYLARALHRIGPGAKEAVPTLLATLNGNKDTHIRIACIDALGAIGPSGKDTVDALLELGKPKKTPYRGQIIIALGNMGNDAKSAVPFLADIVRDAPEPHLRVHALEALSKISPTAKEATDAVAKMLESKHVPKIMVLESLTKAGPLSKELLKAVEETMRDKDTNIRLQAALIVGKTKPNHPAVVSILIETLQEKDAKLRLIAVEGCGNLRPNDEAVVEALTGVMNDPDPAVRKAVVVALAKFKKK